jgi:CheY-like chemotaxis protein
VSWHLRNLAEDSGFMRIALERLLMKAGPQVATVSDGHQAVQIATGKRILGTLV